MTRTSAEIAARAERAAYNKGVLDLVGILERPAAARSSKASPSPRSRERLRLGVRCF